MTCRCPNLYAGMRKINSKNWNPYCQEHGLESDWYNNEEQVEKRKNQQERSEKLQALATLRRKGIIDQEEAQSLKQIIENNYS